MTLAAQAADIYAPVATGLAATEVELGQLMCDVSGVVNDLFQTVNKFGGKRLRPALVHLFGGLVGRPTHEHASLGAIVEALHLSSLLHDDVLDGADTRRRLPTLNALHGNEIPILLGDFIYAEAFSLANALPDWTGSLDQAKTTRRLCTGEIDQNCNRGRFDLPVEEYFRIIEDKTAALYQASARLGGHYAGASARRVAALDEYGRLLGIAFQIVDDVLDCSGETIETGKVPGTDLRDGTPTLPLLLAAREDVVVRRALEGGSLEGALVRVAASGALERSRETALDYARRARASLNGAVRREELEALVDAVVDRDR